MRKKALLSEKGTSLVETSLLVSLIALIAIPSLQFLAHEVADTFCYGAEIIDRGEVISDTSQVYHHIIFNEGNCRQRYNSVAPGSGNGEYDQDQQL